ncbi:hypothetical protein GR160_10940 [Flavobacterium sp. Sd200]|uniref:hypothetical protein n=1 Tax=Flavobacterium sp. Sd200 TaxID=2692211 RepID=UPI00136D8B06|nr:hypothetical protein [Flavobacterium sp. Sd200]MXN91743.1 hypothetical protein [Flavobacterium sp. Sd200]
MKIRASDYKEILDYLLKQRWEGNEFVAFLDDSVAVSKEDMQCFGDDYQAAEFCHELSTDYDTYSFMGIRSVYRSMSEALQDPSLRVEKDGLVDISTMVTAMYQRMDEKILVNNQNNKVMNEKNFEYLNDRVKTTGFGNNLENDLKENMQKQADKFSLTFKDEYGKDKVEATLNFKKSQSGDMYFFNSYDVKVQREKAENAMQQTFYINDKGTINITEAYNLMSGRSINKELETKFGESYNAWIKLDFKQTDDNGNHKQVQFGEKYGYDLEAELKKYPIKGIEIEQYRSELLDSLKKGNAPEVTFIKDGAETKQHLEANPQYKNISVYDEDMRRVSVRQSQGEKQSEGKEQSSKQETTKGQAAEEGAGAQKDKPKRGQHI